jgi:uncharacterized membrane protein
MKTLRKLITAILAMCIIAQVSVGTVWAIVFLFIYVHLWVLPLWIIIAVNILFFIGAMSRMVPAMAIISAVPEAKDRGA